MPAKPARKDPEAHLTPQQKDRVEAIRARRRSPEARAQEAQTRESIQRELRETGTVETDGDGTTMGATIAFLQFVMMLRKERERLGLSLNDMAERAKIDKAALSRLETGQLLNPTVNTLARYAHALGKSLAWGLSDPAVASDATLIANVAPEPNVLLAGLTAIKGTETGRTLRPRRIISRDHFEPDAPPKNERGKKAPPK
jgi:transcriptional regulator with XRE-family HTH domain